MSTKQHPSSSGSDVDEKKRKRKQSNRESARRSRMRKQKHLDDLIAQERRIAIQNERLSQTIDETSQLHIDLDSKNNVLRAQVAELADRLRYLNSVLQIASEVSNLAFDIPDIPDGVLEPWQLPLPSPNQHIPTSAEKFKC